MRAPLTADERERRVVEYLLTLNKGQLAEFRFGRMNRVANFRKALMQLMEEFIEARAEERAAAMIEEFAPARPESQLKALQKARPRRRGKKMPVWLRKEGRALINASVQSGLIVNKR